MAHSKEGDANEFYTNRKARGAAWLSSVGPRWLANRRPGAAPSVSAGVLLPRGLAPPESHCRIGRGRRRRDKRHGLAQVGWQTYTTKAAPTDTRTTTITMTMMTAVSVVSSSSFSPLLLLLLAARLSSALAAACSRGVGAGGVAALRQTGAAGAAGRRGTSRAITFDAKPRPRPRPRPRPASAAITPGARAARGPSHSPAATFSWRRRRRRPGRRTWSPHPGGAGQQNPRR